MNNLRYILATLCLGLLACSSQQDNEPQTEVASSQGEVIEFSSTLNLELPDTTGLEDEELRAFNYKLTPQGKSIKPVIQFHEYQKVPVLCVIRNEGKVSKERPVIIQQIEFTYTKGQLISKSQGITLPAGTNLRKYPNGWRMLCIVGHDSYANGSVSFASQSSLPDHAGAGAMRTIKTLYMNKDKGGSASWTKLWVEQDDKKRISFQAAEDVQMTSVGSVFLIRVENPTNRNKSFNGLQITSNTIAFSGSIQGLNTTTVANGLPKFKGDTGRQYSVNLATPLTVEAGGSRGLYLFYGIPDNANTNQTILTSFTGSRYTRAKTYRYNFNPKANAFYNLRLAHLAAARTHPIEAMMYDGRSNEAYILPKTHYRGTSQENELLIEDGEFHMPTRDEAYALFPGLKETTTRVPYAYRGNGAYGYVNFGDNRTHKDASETITAFNETHTYTADYTNPSPTISYAIRFKGGNRNLYYSAYRYERTATGVKITVRVLGPSGANTTLEQVSNENYWRRKSTVKELVRELPTGAYWTSTLIQNAVNSHSNVMIRVFETTGHAYTRDAINSVYIANMYEHYRHPGIGSNEFPYVLFARTKD